MEFASGGDLSTTCGGIEGFQKNNFSEIKTVLAQMIAGLNSLHKQGLSHGDLKLENVLLSLGTIKLADFGLSSAAGKASRGTPDYMAPEQLDPFNLKGPAADCWSLGICAWELATGLPPFYASDPRLILNSIAQADWERDLAPRAPGPRHYQSLLKGLLNPDPKQRFRIAGTSVEEGFR
jgi:serine/threonine protein kinase